jgi:hypothetical protein
MAATRWEDVWRVRGVPPRYENYRICIRERRVIRTPLRPAQIERLLEKTIGAPGYTERLRDDGNDDDGNDNGHLSAAVASSIALPETASRIAKPVPPVNAGCGRSGRSSRPGRIDHFWA